LFISAILLTFSVKNYGANKIRCAQYDLKAKARKSKKQPSQLIGRATSV